jgi:hypothetical protein
MRRLLVLLSLAGVGWWLVGRLRSHATRRVVVGYEDGSSRELSPGGLEHEALLRIAAEAARR